MAVIKPVITNVGPMGDESCLQVQWTPLTEADSCGLITYPGHSDKSIQVSGTFGGASVAMNGSNEAAGAHMFALNDPSSTVIAITAAGGKAVLENTLFVQPAATGGSGQSLTITMLLRLNNPLRK